MPNTRKPTAVLQKSGALAKNPDRGRARANEPSYPPGVPAPPNFVKGDARAEYDRLAVLLGERGVLQQTDQAILIAYCQHYAKLVELWRQGLSVHHSMLGEFRHLSASLGLSPADRSKVAGTPPKQTEGKWGKVLAMPSGRDDTPKQ